MRIDSVHASGGARQPTASEDLMSRPAPAHVDTLRWRLADAGERQRLLSDAPRPQHALIPGREGQTPDAASSRRQNDLPSAGGIIWGTGQGLVGQGSTLTQRGAESLARGRTLLSESANIFTRYPAQFSQHWEFSKSAVTGKGVPSKPLIDYLNSKGIQHNSDGVKPRHAGSIANAGEARQAGVDPNKINNHNGKVAENALADELRAKGYTVRQNVMVDTPLGKREVDILATKNVGHPTLSEEIRIESKVGKNGLPGTAQGSNVRMQVDKDAAVLAQHRTEAPAAQTRGHQLHAQGTATLDQGGKWVQAGRAAQVVGKIARPVGAVISAFEIGSAYQADGNKVGVNTVGKVAGLAGGAGGAWAGAAAGAALGSVVPGVGTVIGGVVGGIVGGLAGEAVVSGVFNAVKSWF
ncbi:MAG: hypothetical protein Q4G71_09890 [Pseudomonadota bacterium]|nr:hypothetical protein [Pseudomonadota bacterium]